MYISVTGKLILAKFVGKSQGLVMFHVQITSEYYRMKPKCPVLRVTSLKDRSTDVGLMGVSTDPTHIMIGSIIQKESSEHFLFTECKAQEPFKVEG